MRFTVYGIPKPKARARTVRNKHTGNVHSYTPDTTATWEESVIIQAMANKPDKPLDIPLWVSMDFYLPKPASAKKRYWPDRKPDLDNLAKSVFDALEGIYYTNDSRICRKILSKFYDERPRVEVWIEEI